MLHEVIYLHLIVSRMTKVPWDLQDVQCASTVTHSKHHLLRCACEETHNHDNMDHTHTHTILHTQSQEHI